jgi:hypothetical protein
MRTAKWPRGAEGGEARCCAAENRSYDRSYCGQHKVLSRKQFSAGAEAPIEMSLSLPLFDDGGGVVHGVLRLFVGLARGGASYIGNERMNSRTISVLVRPVIAACRARATNSLSGIRTLSIFSFTRPCATCSKSLQCSRSLYLTNNVIVRRNYGLMNAPTDIDVVIEASLVRVARELEAIVAAVERLQIQIAFIASAKAASK